MKLVIPARSLLLCAARSHPRAASSLLRRVLPVLVPRARPLVASGTGSVSRAAATGSDVPVAVPEARFSLQTSVLDSLFVLVARSSSSLVQLRVRTFEQKTVRSYLLRSARILSTSISMHLDTTCSFAALCSGTEFREGKRSRTARFVPLLCLRRCSYDSFICTCILCSVSVSYSYFTSLLTRSVRILRIGSLY